MKAVLLSGHGKPDSLRATEVPEPTPGRDQVRVRIQTIGLNYAEILSRKGQYGWAPPLPYILGMEAYGEIDATGPGVKERRIGEKVIVVNQSGCYAEKVVVPELQALPAIDVYSPEENAAFAVSYLTAWISLFEMARLRPADRVLIQAAAGGVGTAAVQLAKHFGCSVYAAAGSEEKLERLRALNVDHAINYRTHDIETELAGRVGAHSVDVVLALVAGEPYQRALKTLAPFGRVVIAGVAGLELHKWNPLSWRKAWRDMPRADIRRMAVGSYGVMATHIGYLLKTPARMSSIWQELTTFVLNHGIRPVVGSTFTFDQITQAHALMESRGSYGKIVVRV